MTIHKLPLTQHLSGPSRQIYGCMGLGGGWNSNAIEQTHVNQTHEVVDTALAAGINIFDHADIYTFGKAEKVFGEVLRQRSELREQMFVQSKCAIRFEDEHGPGRYDFSKEWIENSVDGILTRLSCDYLDVLMLHRPDPLMELDELAKTLHFLKDSGKVKHFGVSNMHCYQIARIQKAIELPLVCNQLEMSLKSHLWLDEGLYAGHGAASSARFSASTVEYCSDQGIQLQAWGSLSQGLFSRENLSEEAANIQATASLVKQLAEQHQCPTEAIVLAWLQRHPANIQPVIGTTNLQRIAACAQANQVQLSREDWYALYVSARGEPLP